MVNVFKKLSFSPSELIGDMSAMIEAAQENIWVAMFWFDYKPFADSLISARHRGVEVKVIVDKRSLLAMHDMDIEYNLSVPEYLRKNDIIVWIYEGEDHIFHHKFMIIDQKNLLYSTCNWYHNDLKHNLDCYFLIEDNSLCQEVGRWYKQLEQRMIELSSVKESEKTSCNHIARSATTVKCCGVPGFMGIVSRLRHNILLVTLFFVFCLSFFTCILLMVFFK